MSYCLFKSYLSLSKILNDVHCDNIVYNRNDSNNMNPMLYYFKEKKTLPFMSKKKLKYNNNVIKLFSRKNEMKNNKSDNSLLIPSYNNKYVSMYPYMKKHSSVKEIRIPISTDNSVGITDGKCITMGSEYNGKKKEVIRLNLFRKTGCNFARRSFY